jgi:hypothetical protein
MIDLMLLLVIVLVVILGLVAAVLFIPVDILLRLCKEGLLTRLLMSFKLVKGLAAGGIDIGQGKREFRLQIIGITVLRRDLEEKEEAKKKKKKKEKKKEKEKEEKEKEKEKGKKKPPDWKKIVWDADVLYDSGKKLAVALITTISLKRLDGKVKVGLSDAGQTGMFTGLLYAGNGITKGFLPESRIEIEPSFEQERLDADFEIELKLPLYKLVIPLIRFFRRIKKL